METLEKIVPSPVRVDVAGERITLTPIKVRELPLMLRVVGPVLYDLMKNPGQGFEERLFAALSTNADDLMTAVSVASRRDREWVDSLDVDDLLILISGVLEVNTDFFLKRVLPILKEK